MKTTNITATIAALTASAYAQNATSNATSLDLALTSTLYQYVNDCPESDMVTATDVVTYCHLCEAAGMTTYPGGSLTTYVTVLSEVCPTGGLQDKTYTVTEPCPSSEALARSVDHVPQGFMVTTVPCGCAENTPVPITTPGPALASAQAAGVPAVATAVPTPGAAEKAASGSPEAPAPGKEVSPAAAPAGSPEAAPASSPEDSPEGGISSPESPATGNSSPARSPESPIAAGGAPAAASPPYATLAGSENKAVSPSGTGSPSTNSTLPFLGSATQRAPCMTMIAALLALVPAFVVLRL